MSNMTMSPLAPTPPSKTYAGGEPRSRAAAENGFGQMVAGRQETGSRDKVADTDAAVKTQDAELSGDTKTAGEEEKAGREAETVFVSPKTFTLPDRFAAASGEPLVQEDGRDREDRDAGSEPGEKEALRAARENAEAPIDPRVKPDQAKANMEDAPAPEPRPNEGQTIRAANGEKTSIRDGMVADPAVSRTQADTFPRKAVDPEGARESDRPANAGRSEASPAQLAFGAQGKAAVAPDQPANAGKSAAMPVQPTSQAQGKAGGEPRRELRARSDDSSAPGRKDVTAATEKSTDAKVDSAPAGKTAAVSQGQADPSAARPSVAAGVASSIIDAVASNTNWSTFLKATTAQIRETQTAQGQMLQAIKVQLHPAELGALTLNLRAIGDRIIIDIKAEEHTARKLVADGLDTVAKSFQTLGYQVDQVNLTTNDGRSASLNQWGGAGRERGEADGRRQDGGYPDQTAHDDRSTSRDSRDERASSHRGSGRTLYI